jgi:hypothetical protein
VKNDGARAAQVTTAFLGQRANKEGNALIVDPTASTTASISTSGHAKRARRSSS